MTRKEFNNLKEGDIVITNGMCGDNTGIKCQVTYIDNNGTNLDVVGIKPVDSQRTFSGDYTIDPDWNEVSYKAVSIIK